LIIQPKDFLAKGVSLPSLQSGLGSELNRRIPIALSAVLVVVVNPYAIATDGCDCGCLRQTVGAGGLGGESGALLSRFSGGLGCGAHLGVLHVAASGRQAVVRLRVGGAQRSLEVGLDRYVEQGDDGVPSLLGVRPVERGRFEVSLQRTNVVDPFGGQAHAVDAVEEQVARPVLADGVTGVDVAAQPGVEGAVPLPLDVVGPHDGDGGLVHARPGGGHEGDVQVEAPLVLDEVHGEDAAPRLGADGADGLPVHEVGRAEQDDGGAGLEGGEGHVVPLPDAQDGGVGVVPAHDGVAVGAVAEVGAALVLNAAPPRGGGIGAHGAGEPLCSCRTRL